MADSPFVAEIVIYPYNFAPKGWAFCDGQLLPISQNTALFSLLGTMYGGDGKATFALPNLQGAAPMMWGQGPSLSDHFQGETGGSESVTLLESEIPSHSHAVQGTAGIGNQNNATGNVFGRPFGGGSLYRAAAGAPPVNLAFETIAPTGSHFPHNNMQPYLVLNFCIALQGAFPPRG